MFKSHFNPRFQERFPHITIDYTPIPSGEWQGKFIVLYASGTPGDLIWSNQADQMHLFSAAGMHKPLDDYVKADRYDLGGYYPKAIADNRWQSKLYGLPWQSHAGLAGLWVNLDLARQHGVALPDPGDPGRTSSSPRRARLTREPDGLWGTFLDTPNRSGRPRLLLRRHCHLIRWDQAGLHRLQADRCPGVDGVAHPSQPSRPRTQERRPPRRRLCPEEGRHVHRGSLEIPNVVKAVQDAFPWGVISVPKVWRAP